MSNPWLGIPLEDYEAHMAAVRQMGVLSDLFAEALMVRQPGSVAVLGVAGGNGLERIESRLTRRIVGLDFQPQYLEAVRRRFPDLHGLELHCIDLARETVKIAPVDLVHAALVLEHMGGEGAGLDRCLNNAVSLIAPDGALSVVLQLPSQSEAQVGPSGVASMKSLINHFAAIPPLRLHELLRQRGLEPVWETQRQQPSGKSFWMGIFLRA
jgi:trans-aconitate methyltransferase